MPNRGNSKPRRFTENIKVGVTPEMFEWVGRQAQIKGLFMTDFIRRLIAERMEGNG